MARGLKKHLKRLNAPKHWMLDKLGGAFAPKPSSRPHKSREGLPLILILRNKLKYALTYQKNKGNKNVLLSIYKEMESYAEYKDIQVMLEMLHSRNTRRNKKPSSYSSYWRLCVRPN